MRQVVLRSHGAASQRSRSRVVHLDSMSTEREEESPQNNESDHGPEQTKQAPAEVQARDGAHGYPATRAGRYVRCRSAASSPATLDSSLKAAASAAGDV